MREYQIITDVTADIILEIYEEYPIDIIPMECEIDGKSFTHYQDSRELDCHTFYEKLRNKSTASTSQINILTYMEHFEKALSKGKDVLYIAFSTGLSGTYQSSLLAAEELKEKYPDNKIICVDSLCASVGEGLLVYTAAKKQKEGYDIDSLKSWIEENRLHLCHWFTVDDLYNLKRGGRVSAATAILGTALNIKPVLHVDDEGHLIPVSKERGRIKPLKIMLQHMKDTCINPEEQVIFIGHGDDMERAKEMEKLVRNEFNVVDVKIGNIGPIIGAHSGPGTIALFFYGTKR